VCGPKKFIVKKDVKSKVVACDGRLIAKFLIATIQVNLVPNPCETWRRRHKFTWIVLIKNFTISLSSQPFLGRHLGFHILFHKDLFGATHIILQLGSFRLDENFHPISWLVVFFLISAEKSIHLVLNKLIVFSNESYAWEVTVSLEYTWLLHWNSFSTIAAE